MTATLKEAVESFDDFAEAQLAPRYLLNPTDSFRTIVEGLANSAPDLPNHQGILQARDDSAALIFVTLQQAPFNVSQQSALNARINGTADATGHTALIVGPRPISAQISTRISQRATLSAGLATVLLMAWLIWLTRSIAGLLRILLPVTVGAAIAALSVQITFGNVHVLALGFGGALMGMAIDYPIHMISHSDTPDNRNRALRCVFLGAITTAIAFLAISVADIPALTQIGIFVAVGLIVAAGVCMWLGPSFAAAALRPPSRHVSVLRVPAPMIILAGTAIIAAAALWIRPQGDPPSLVHVPEAIKADITRLGQMQDLPSGQFQIKVTGDALPAVLSTQAHLKPVLEAARSQGDLRHWHMLADLLPSDRQSLPPPEQVTANVPAALTNAGVAPGFATDIADAYKTAYATAARPGPIPRELLETTGLGSLLWPDQDGLISTVHLWDVSNPHALAKMIEELNNPKIQFIDQRAGIYGQLKTLTATVLRTLGIGAILALGFLMVFRRDAPQIALATIAATALTALLISLIAGTLGIFQIVALVLVTGIGIDYGLFLRNDASDRAFQVAASSVTRCAVTTLIAFVTMAFSGVTVLQNIGMTVSVGVLAMLAAHLLRAHESVQR